MLIRRVEKLEEAVAQLKKSQLQSSTGFRETTDTIGIDDGMYKDLTNRILQLQAEIDALRNELAKWLKEFQDSLNNKADLEAL